jgi:signal transduction histidine kinase/CheY-like chemotaxis protein/Tfp pilus assembly protein PilF
MKPTIEQINALLSDAYKCRVNNVGKSIQLAGEALKISKEINDQQLIATSHNQLSLYFMIMSDYALSTFHSEEAIRYFEALEDEKGIADAKYNIASVYYKTDNFHLGIIFLIDALKTYHKFDDWHNQSRVEKSLGTIYEYIGDQNNAVISYENAIEAAKKAGDINLESNAYNNLSGVYIKQDKMQEAQEMIDWSIAMKQRSGDTRGQAFAIYGRGKVRFANGQYAEAEADFVEAIRIHRDMGERLGLGMAYNKLGALYLTTGELEKAKITAGEAHELSNQYKMIIVKYKSYYLLYKIHKQENDHIRALEYLEMYQREKESVINTQTLKVIENYEIIIRMKTLEREAELQKEKAEIIEKKNRAEQAVRVRQEFLSAMSHEIRTPLNAICTIVKLLDRQVDEENKKLIDSLGFASDNLIRIINDILDFTRLDEKKAKLENSAADLKTLCENTIRTYEGLAREKNLELVLDADPDLAERYIFDETKLGQILGNLVSNAIKFTDSGNVTISVKKTGQERKCELLEFKISDTGEGIPEKYQQEIFESFSQVKPHLTKKQGGTGLGLTIVRKLLDLFGATINVKSKVNEGTVFYFTLKLQRAAIQPVQAPGNFEQLTGRHALLAEDNQVNAMIMLKLLTRWGITADHVLNGKEAFSRAQQTRYDFILMDIHMPEMNGLEATELIRTKYNLNADVPVFAVTADVMASSDKEFAHYFTGFLSKPLEIEKLYAALAESITEKQRS